MIDIKQIKKLAAACRVAGISAFKCADFEFVLTPEAPVSRYKKQQASKVSPGASAMSAEFETDSLTQEQLLAWSLRESPEDEKAE